MNRRERGNIFFTLFGAVAIVGVLGAVTVSMMKGPLSTMVEVNRRTMADTQMQISSKLAMMTAAMGAEDGDCEADTATSTPGDGFVEPPEWEDASGAGPDGVAGSEGGGFVPASVGAGKMDPWGTNYGYCVWDAGPVVNDAKCGGATQKRLIGSGDSDRNYPVLAIISAGPDRKFQTGCVSFNTADNSPHDGTYDPATEKMIRKASGSDDIVIEFTYAEASVTAGGLWELSPGAPNTADIAKNIHVSGTGTFDGGLTLGSGSGDFPLIKTDAIDTLSGAPPTMESGIDLNNTKAATACTSSTLGLLAVDAATPKTLSVCLDDGAGTATWYDIGGAAAGFWKTGASAGQIYYDHATQPELVGIGVTNPAQALDVSGSIKLTGDLMLDNTHILQWGDGTTSIKGSGGGSLELLTGGGTRFSIDQNGLAGLGVSPAAATRLLIQGTTSDNTAAGLNVTDSAASSVLFVRNDGKVGINDSTPSDALDITGEMNINGKYIKMTSIPLLSADTTKNTVFLGQGALDATGLGISNTVVGGSAAAALTSGTYNTVLGAGAGATLATGDNNILIGANDTTIVDVPAATTSDYLNIGNLIYGDLSGKHVGIGQAAGVDVSTFNDALEVAGNVQATGNIEASTYSVGGISFGPPRSDCNTTSQKLMWNSATGWQCYTDQDNADGDADATNELQTLSQVLTYGVAGHAAGDAEGNPAYNLSYVHVGSGGLSDSDLEFEVEGDALVGTLSVGGSGEASTGLELEVNGDAQIDTLKVGGLASAVGAGIGLEVHNTLYAADKVGIGTSTPSTGGTGGDLTLDVEGNVGAIKYCDENGDNCFLASDVGSALGLDTFIELTDTPNSYATHANQFVRVNGTPDALIFSDIYINDLADAVTDYTGDFNMFIGQNSGAGILATGQYNTALGISAGKTISTGDNNTAFGWHAGQNIDTGTNNTTIGFDAGQAITTGEWNTLVGGGAGRLLDAGADNNVMIGNASGDKVNGTSDENVLIGSNIMFGGAARAISGATIVGYNAGNANQANGVTFMGWNAGAANTTGADNLFIGYQAALANTTGARNTVLGQKAGALLDGGNDNILIGYNVNVPTATTKEYLNIGNLFYGDIGATSTDPRVGAAKYCDATLTTCFTAAQVSGGSTGVFERSGTLVRPNTGYVTLATDDFVFGSQTLDSSGAEASRFFFDKSKAAFYAGTDSGTLWDTVGNNSFVFGKDSQAAGAGSMALGTQAVVTAAGANSMAIGLGATAGAAPQVSAANSLGIFLGDQNGANLSDASTVSIMGASGGVGIGTLTPATALDVVGTVQSSTGMLTADGQSYGWGDNTTNITGSGAADTIEIYTAGTKQLTMTSGGNVGIGGDTIPDLGLGGQLKLDVEGNVGAIKYCDENGDNCFLPTDVAGGALDIEQVLTNGNDANGKSAVGLAGVGIGTNAALEAQLEIQGAEATDATLALDADDGDDATDTWFVKSLATGNSLSFENDVTQVMALSSGGNLQIDGDLTISGDDLFMGTNTTGYILVADGTNFNPVAMSGDVTINSTGATAIGADKITEPMIKSIDAPTDEYCLTYESGGGGDFEWQPCVAAGTNALSALTDATVIHSLANADFAQTWNWDTLAAQTAMTFGSTSVTSGKILSVTSSSAAMTGTLADVTLSGNNAANTGTLIKSTVSGASSAAVPLMITNAGTGLSLRVNDDGTDTDGTPVAVTASGDMGVGTVSPGAKLDVNGSLKLAGIAGNAPTYISTTSAALSALTDATTGHTLANANNAQVWNWDTLAAQTAMTFGSTSVTSGKILSVTSSSAAMTGTLADVTLSGNNAANTGTVIKSTVSGASSAAVPVMITNAGTGLSLRVNDDGTDTDSSPFIVDAAGKVGIGNTSPQSLLHVSGDILMANGATCSGTGTNKGALQLNAAATGIQMCDGAGTWVDIVGTGGAGSVALSALTAATTGHTLANGVNGQIWNWALTAAGGGMTFGESAASSGGGASDQYILSAKTLATSTAIPLFIENAGNGASFRVDDASGDTSPFIITKDGNVGIGNTAPQSLLHVSGDILMANGATCSGTGTNKGALQLNAAGTGIQMCDGAGTWVDIAGTGGANSVALSALTAAAAGRTLANANNAQVWNWDTLAAQTAMTFGSTSVTSGKILSVTSSSAAMTGTLADVTLSGNNAANTGTVIKSTVSGASSAAVPLMITNAGTGLSLRVNDDGTDTDSSPFIVDASGKVGIGNTSPQSLLHVSGDLLLANSGTCDGAGANKGALRLNAAGTGLEMCNGAGTWAAFVAATTVNNFVDLGDTPNSYAAGDKYKILMVNSTPNGVQFADTSAVLLPAGTTAQQPASPVDGMLRYNSNLADFEGRANGAWETLGPDGSGLWTDSGAGYIQYNATYGGIKVGAVTGAAAPVLPTLAGLSDVNAAGVSDGQYIKWDNATSKWIPGTLSGTVALSSLTDATTGRTLANANNAQVWNWDTLAAQTAMTFGSTSVTSGKILSVTSSSAAMTGTLADVTLSGNNAANTGTVIKSTVSGASSAAVPLMITNAGTGLSLRVNDDGTDTDSSPFIVDASGNVGIGVTSTTYKLQVNGEAAKPGGGSWSNASDIRLKDLHGDYQRGLDDILKLHPVRFSYKKGNPRGLPSDPVYAGFIAQDVQKIFPEAVTQAPDGYYDFNMHSINVAMVNAVQELQAENNGLKAELAGLKADRNDMHAALENIQGQLDILNKSAIAGTGKASSESLWVMFGLMALLGCNMAVVFRRGRLLKRDQQ